MIVRTLVNKVLFMCKRSVENYFTPYLANKVLFAKVRSSVYKFIRCLAQIYACCRLSSFGLTETAKYKLPYILYATFFAESAKRLRRVAPPLGPGAQRRFDRVKRSANQDHVRHRRSIAFVFTTVPRDFRLGGRFGGLN